MTNTTLEHKITSSNEQMKMYYIADSFDQAIELSSKGLNGSESAPIEFYPSLDEAHKRAYWRGLKTYAVVAISLEEGKKYAYNPYAYWGLIESDIKPSEIKGWDMYGEVPTHN